MGRYPLMAAAELYLEKRKLQVGPATYNNDRRIIRYFVGEIEQMREGGIITTTNPQEIGPAEVRAFIDWMRDPSRHSKGRPLDPDTQVRYLSKLEAILRMKGNKVLELMRDEGYTFPKRAGAKPIRAIPEPDLMDIQAAAQRVKSCPHEPPGWRRAKSTLLSTMYVATGVRPSELRLSHFEDLDLRKWRFNVRTPKGVGVWAEQRTVTIMPPYREAIQGFIREREELLRFYGRRNATHLVPNLRGVKEQQQDRPYSANHFRELKEELEEISGIDFRIKDFRPTFATLTVEKDPTLLVDVSAQLGHASLATTQRYYARISAESAGSRLEKAWSGRPAPQQGMGSEAVLGLLLKAFGINTPEDLQRVLASNAPGLLNPRIEGSGQTYIR
jgi:integrase